MLSIKFETIFYSQKLGVVDKKYEGWQVEPWEAEWKKDLWEEWMLEKMSSEGFASLLQNIL